MSGGAGSGSAPPPAAGPGKAPAAEQLTLLRGTTRGRRPRPVTLAEALPVARVVVDIPLPHLDRPYDYAVPEALADTARPGVRVRVRFAGRDVDGFVLDRIEVSEHSGRLSPLRRVVSAERVLRPEVFRLAAAVAQRYAGSVSDVLRLAVPPRHAATEQAGAAPVLPDPVPAPEVPGPWADYPAGGAFLSRLAAGESPRAVWTALPGSAWADAIATAVAVTAAGDRAAVVVLPDRRDVDAVVAALTGLLPPDRFVRLEADLGPAERYRAFLALCRDQVRVAVGTRAAAFAPVRDLGLAVIWDDGDDLHAEPRAPYPHAREVLALRAEQDGAAMLIGGWSRTAEAALLLRDGWARAIDAPRTVLRARWPRVAVADAAASGDDPAGTSARMPTVAWRAIQNGLARGPVLVQVPRAGYLPGLTCQGCRRPARCPHCHGPVVLAGRSSPNCAWCGRVLAGWACPTCHDPRLRARAVGVDRTAEELGRAFPGTPVVVSRAQRELPRVSDRTLVLATPGVEPAAPGPGYAAAVLLDGDSLLQRPDLRAAEEALRRWRAAAALVRPGNAGGVVVLCADPAAAPVQALVRGDPGGHAERELAERAELGLPPAVIAASVTGEPAAVAGLLAATELPPGTRVLGPSPVLGPSTVAGSGSVAGASPAAEAEAAVRAVLFTDRAREGQLARALRVASAIRSARRDPGSVRVRMDPRDLG